MGTTIKYRYALDANRQVVDIAALTTADRRDYECIACGHPMRPVMGNIRQKHFRHREEVQCSPETYLHKLGKLLFYQIYQRCLDERTPFEIEYWQPRSCIACQDLGPCKLKPTIARYDLTQRFTQLSLETPDNAFIPDLLLQSEQGEKLYVEIAVTHLVTEAKRASGTRIIEIAVDEEANLQIISDRLLSENSGRVTFVNFRTREQKGDFSRDCNTLVYVFFLWPSGKSVIQPMTIPRFRKRIQGPEAFYYTVVSDAQHSVYLEAVERAHLNGHKVENCFLCRYHARPNARQREQDAQPVYCKFLRQSCASNDAATCEFYRPDAKVFTFYPDGNSRVTPCNLRELHPSRALDERLKSQSAKELFP